MQKQIPALASIFMALSLILTACGSSSPAPAAVESTDSLSGNIAISGAFALYPMVTIWAEEFQKIHPNVTFDISGGGAGKGMTDALTGAVDIGMVSREVKEEELAQGAYPITVVKDAVFPIVNVNNPVMAEIKAKGISQETFIKIFITGGIKTWGEVVGKPDVKDEIHVYTRSDSAGAAEMWAGFLGNKKQEDLLGVGVNADPGLLEAVQKDPLGIGYNNLGYAFDPSSGLPVAGVLPAPIDVNHNGAADADESADTQARAVELISTGKYPSPPARGLNLVTNGKPGGLTQVFIEWALTDGQQYVSQAGFVQLTPDQLAESLARVK